MTAAQSSYLSWLMACHAEATRVLNAAYPASVDAAAERWCAISRELRNLRREIQATERSAQ